jgi:hypothetical protein
MNFTPQSAMQRIQVGLIGLVAVLLFVSIANMIFDRNANRDGVASKDATSETKASETRDEPLAELGVAPTVSGQPESSKAPERKTGSQ